MELYIFNPDTDYALSQGRQPYTPPKSIENLRRRLMHITASLARPGDLILEPGDTIPTDKIAEITAVRPWGWNHTLRKQLLRMGIPGDLIPSEEWIDGLRLLSHRRTTIEFNRRIGYYPLPEEFTDISNLKGWIEQHPRCFLKAPWSSAGRGIMCIDESTSCKLWQGWTEGIIHRQGSVMAEVTVEKRIDFATEWIADGKNVRFLGLSVFDADKKGNYIENLMATQEELTAKIIGMLKNPEELSLYISKQQELLEEMLEGRYEGPLGIDMMIDQTGEIIPCVEINLRTTMGHVALAKAGIFS